MTNRDKDLAPVFKEGDFIKNNGSLPEVEEYGAWGRLVSGLVVGGMMLSQVQGVVNAQGPQTEYVADIEHGASQQEFEINGTVDYHLPISLNSGDKLAGVGDTRGNYNALTSTHFANGQLLEGGELYLTIFGGTEVIVVHDNKGNLLSDPFRVSDDNSFMLEEVEYREGDPDIIRLRKELQPAGPNIKVTVDRTYGRWAQPGNLLHFVNGVAVEVPQESLTEGDQIIRQRNLNAARQAISRGLVPVSETNRVIVNINPDGGPIYYVQSEHMGTEWYVMYFDENGDLQTLKQDKRDLYILNKSSGKRPVNDYVLLDGKGKDKGKKILYKIERLGDSKVVHRYNGRNGEGKPQWILIDPHKGPAAEDR